jgi:hypothetical protein
MKEVSLALPVFAFVVATRAALGAGIGLLIAGRLPEHQRRTAGAALVGIGAAATLPAALAVIRGVRRAGAAAAPAWRETTAPARVERDPRLVGASRFPRKGDDAF